MATPEMELSSDDIHVLVIKIYHSAVYNHIVTKHSYVCVIRLYSVVGGNLELRNEKTKSSPVLYEGGSR